MILLSLTSLFFTAIEGMCMDVPLTKTKYHFGLLCFIGISFKR